MKRNIFVMVAMVLCLGLLSCGGNGAGGNADAERDSLKNENARLNEFLNIVASTMDSINGQEQMLYVDKEGRQLSNKEQIRENIKIFQFTLDEQRKKVAELESRMGRENEASTAKFKAIISNLQMQIRQKEEMIAQLQQDLENKNIDIQNLRSHVARLNDNVTSLTQTNTEQQEVIKAAESEITNMSVAYVKIGTKKELSAAGLLKGGLFSKKKVNLSSVDNSLFRTIDIRKTTSFEIPGKDVSVKSQHPRSSYNILNNGNSSVLEITNTAQFWSVSHYLVIQYK